MPRTNITPPTIAADMSVPNTANTTIEPMLAKKFPCNRKKIIITVWKEFIYSSASAQCSSYISESGSDNIKITLIITKHQRCLFQSKTSS